MFWLFILGSAVGSFLNVVSLRYDPERFILSTGVIGGRSACPRCGKKLAWYELIPLVSFLVQGGRCRECKTKISLQYPLVEVLTGLIFVLVGVAFLHAHIIESVIWIIVFSTLLLLALIDARLNLIPDEASVLIVLAGVALLALPQGFSLTEGSFVGSYAAIFGLRSSLLLNHVIAALFGGLFFGFLILITRGRGMGIGDLKLAAALGFLFGWPDIILIIALSFIIGALFGFITIIWKRKTMKSFLPFGPFLALGSALTFFWGYEIVSFYFSLFPL